jgi:2,5-furandicarboxylate decarboxylase 1
VTAQAVGPVDSLRDAVGRLVGRGEAAVVERDVDPAWEVTAVLERLEVEGRTPAVLYRSIAGWPGWSILGNLFASRTRIADLAGLDHAHLTSGLSDRLAHPIEPVLVSDGPVHEHTWTGTDASLQRIPLVTHHEGDAAPYVSMGVAVCRDPDSGRRNVGIYRFMKLDERHLVPSLTSISDIADIFRRQELRGRPLEVAIMPGVHPMLSLAATFKAPPGVDEYGLAGGLVGRPLELVRARTVDLEVPADAEVVIEGRILPGDRVAEAPFADMSRSYSRVKRGPLTEVTAISHRARPILQLSFSGHADATYLAAVCHEVAVDRAARAVASGLRGVHVPASGFGLHCYLALEKTPTVEGGERGEQVNAMLAAVAAVPQLKLVIALDHDVDIYTDRAVLEALARRFQPVDALTREDRLMVIRAAKGATYDPSSFHHEYPNSKLLIDATVSSDLTPEQREGMREARAPRVDEIDLSDYLGDGQAARSPDDGRA